MSIKTENMTMHASKLADAIVSTQRFNESLCLSKIHLIMEMKTVDRSPFPVV